MATQRRRLFLSVWLALIGAFAAVPTDPARAGVIFRYDGACTHTACPDVGLDVGDPVSARIGFADTPSRRPRPGHVDGWLTRRRGPCADSGAPRRT